MKKKQKVCSELAMLIVIAERLVQMNRRDIKDVPGECIEILISVDNQTLLTRRAIAEY